MLSKAPSVHTLRVLHAQLRQSPFTCRRCCSSFSSSSSSSSSSSPLPTNSLSIATTARPRQRLHQWAPTPSAPRRRQSGQQLQWKRHLSQAVPVTAVNAKQNIPSAFGELHEALGGLLSKGANYVNLSQVRLALRGLEVEDAMIRVAVLGINGQLGARRFVRALLADPLGPEQEWESVLLDSGKDDGRGLLIKYGEDVELDDHHPLLRTISLPSAFLHQHRLELLVYESNAATYTGLDAESDEGLLVPSLSTPISATGESSLIAYPVHKSLVYGEGLNDARDMFQLVQPRSGEPEPLIYGALNLEMPGSADSATDAILPIDLLLGEFAIKKFRESLHNSSEYQSAWRGSQLPNLLDVLASGTSLADSPLKPVLHAQILWILNNTSAAILKDEMERLTTLTSSPVSAQTRQHLQDAITSWAERAHTELREDLATALESRSWRKLAWWKLVWRIDDINLLLTDVIQRSYLSSAEKHIIWIGGRLQEAGVLPPISNSSTSSFSNQQQKEQTQQQRGLFSPPTIEDMKRLRSESVAAIAASSAAKESLAGTNSNIIDDPSTVHFDPSLPWPQQITLSRARLLSLIPPLQARAQALLLQSLSTSALTTAIGALAYVSVSGTSLYEAGAVASLGIAWGARRLQVQWERARKGWMDEVEREGVKVLGEAERRCRRVVEVGPEMAREEEDVEEEVAKMELDERKEARRAVERVREALDRV